jgi:hypothetical protein
MREKIQKFEAFNEAKKEVEYDNLYQWYLATENDKWIWKSKANVIKDAKKYGFSAKDVNDLLDDIEQGGSDYAKYSDDKNPQIILKNKKLRKLDDKTGIFENVTSEQEQQLVDHVEQINFDGGGYAYERDQTSYKVDDLISAVEYLKDLVLLQHQQIKALQEK